MGEKRWSDDLRERVEWRWWNRTDPELGLLGFATRKDRDAFSNGKPGPFRRVVASDGRTILQGEDFRQMVRRLAHDAGIAGHGGRYHG